MMDREEVTAMSRQMRDPSFLAEQRARKYAPHVEPINRLVDDLTDSDGGRWAPYVAPHHGGCAAPVLALLRDPGPMTNDQEGRPGSGFLSSENDDPTAERFTNLLEGVGLDSSQITPWNAYPWYINRAPRDVELRVGTTVLARLMPLLGSVRVVLLLGQQARRSWTLFAHAHPELAAQIATVDTRHTSSQAFITRDPDQRARWIAEQLQAFETVAALVRGDPTAPWVTTEASLVTAFCDWLRADGWDPLTEVNYADIVATRGNERLVVEAKGRTSDASLDADTVYGQILRHMTPATAGEVRRYAIAAPESSRRAILRVPVGIRRQLGIEIYLVGVDGAVTKVES
jgi:hypothetical protein